MFTSALSLALVVAASDASTDGGVLETTPSVWRLRAVGDVMLGTTVPEGHLAPDDGAHLLDDVAPVLRDAELTFVNLEGPLCDSGTSNKCRKGSNCFAFRSKTSYANYLEGAGVDLASTANNHAGDFGEGCRRETERALDAHHIVWSGPVGSIGTALVQGKRVALVAFQTSPSTNDVNDLPTAVALVKRAAASADFVVVSFHGGAEGTNATHVKDGAEKYLGENRGDLKPFAHAMIDAGAHVVVGHGPHVLRAMEIYKRHLIAYSLGNFATYGRFDLSGPLSIAVVLEVSLDAKGEFAGGRVFSIKQEGRGVPKLDPSGRGAAMVGELSKADFPQTGVVVAPDGSLSAR